MMMGGDGNGEVVSVPPGFRFHPTDEELLYYYLLKKISYEAIDLDVIREVDLNKLEPWDLKEKCRIGTGDQNEWYFFSHKDKKYPTGSRTNRATTAGFWKATGRDKAIHHLNKGNGNGSWNSKRIIGMRKTLVFYTGRAPHGQKTDWIMHEYRLDDHDRHFNISKKYFNSSSTPLPEVQEDGWVVCRVFKKKNQNRISLGAQPEDECEDDDHLMNKKVLMASVESKQAAGVLQGPHIINYQLVHNPSCNINTAAAGTGTGTSTSSMLDSNNMHLPQLLSSPPPSDQAAVLEHTTNCGCGYHNSDWSFLDKLLASHHQHQQHNINTLLAPEQQHQTLLHSSSSHAPTPHDHLFSFHYFGHQN